MSTKPAAKSVPKPAAIPKPPAPPKRTKVKLTDSLALKFGNESLGDATPCYLVSNNIQAFPPFNNLIRISSMEGEHDTFVLCNDYGELTNEMFGPRAPWFMQRMQEVGGFDNVKLVNGLPVDRAFLCVSQGKVNGNTVLIAPMVGDAGYASVKDLEDDYDLMKPESWIVEIIAPAGKPPRVNIFQKHKTE